MPDRSFALTYDYRCPFARNAHEHVVTALQAGAGWDVRFTPFSLTQSHVHDGEAAVWDEPAKDSGLLALMTSVAVRDHWPERFGDFHLAMFAARHDEGRHIRDEQVVADVLSRCGLDARTVLDEVHAGAHLKAVKAEHESAVHDHRVWGVPTFVMDGQSVFVRFMHRPRGDADLAHTTISRVLDLLAWPELNEFKHTSLPQ